MLSVTFSVTQFSMYFSILNGVKIKITHNILPINHHSSINVTSVSLSDCLSESASWVNLFLEILLQWRTAKCNI